MICAGDAVGHITRVTFEKKKHIEFWKKRN